MYVPGCLSACACPATWVLVNQVRLICLLILYNLLVSGDPPSFMMWGLGSHSAFMELPSSPLWHLSVEGFPAVHSESFHSDSGLPNSPSEQSQLFITPVLGSNNCTLFLLLPLSVSGMMKRHLTSICFLHVCACVCMGAREQTAWVSFLRSCLLFGYGLFQWPGLYQVSRIASKLTKGHTCFCLPSTGVTQAHQHLFVFCLFPSFIKESSLCLHACKASIFPMELYL